MKFSIGIAVLVLLLGGLAWFVFDRADAPEVDLGNAPSLQADVPTASPVVVDRSRGDAEQETRRAFVEEASSPEPKEARSAHIVGRCVNENGEPLAGCVVRLIGVRGSPKRMDAWLKDHAGVVWEDPGALTTLADGRFEIRFVPPTPYRFELDVRAPACVDVCGRWQCIEEGRRVDLGDITLVAGAGVSGRILTTKGSPVAKARLSLRWENPRTAAVPDRRGELTPVVSHEVTTATDGRFALPSNLQAGTWNLHVREHQIVEPQKIELHAAGQIECVDVVVVAEEDIETMTGVVVDDRGALVEGARIFVFPWLQSARDVTETARDGTFTIRRGPADPDGPFTVRASANGYEAGSTDDSCAWGATGLCIVMRRGVAVEVCVRSPTGEPVEEYGVRVFTKPGSSNLDLMTTGSTVRNRGKHAGGLTTVTGLVRGPHVLLVEPSGRTWQRSSWHEFEVTGSGAPRQDVELRATVSRVVRVTRAHGVCIEGTRVQLVESPSKVPVDLDTRVYDDFNFLFAMRRTNCGLRVDDVVTDERGEATLEGPGGTVLAVRVLGPGHVPICQNDVVLDRGDGPIEIVVPSGACVVGALRPVELLERLRSQSGLPSSGRLSASEAARAPGVRLVRTVGTSTERVPLTNKQVCRADGSFVFDGVPPGTWTLELVMSTYDSRVNHNAPVAVAQVKELTDGETREVDIDLTNHVRSMLTARVALDGSAFANGRVALIGRGIRDVNGKQAQTHVTVRTDDAGEFEQLVPPGQYHAVLWLQDSATNRWERLVANESVIVHPGQATTASFVVHTATVRIAVRDSRGKKVTSVHLVAERPFDVRGIWLPQPDDEGVILTRLVSGTWMLRVRRAEFMDERRYREFLVQHPGDADVRRLSMHDVREIEVTSAGPVEFRVDLPASAGF
ncbi:MAG: carboxypeptidase regulatory-like domain-containing protein [Planctomycetes bacterium]|nr:carboxypeptidase regulatory-like domain-containing protein [Planctomycetota bacterium]